MSLARAGIRVTLVGCAHDDTSRPVVLNSNAVYLLDHLLEPNWRTALACHRLSRRIVLWGNADPMTLDEPSLVVDASELGKAAGAAAYRSGVTSSEDAGEPQGWTIVAAQASASPATTGLVASTGGQRRATLVRAALSKAADPDALVIEAHRSGWCALVPTGKRTGVLFSFTAHPQGTIEADDGIPRIVDQTSALKHSIARLEQPGGSVQAAPRLQYPAWFAPRSVLAGPAALAFDPLSGDGTAAALRSAHLASSIVRAATSGTPVDSLLTFYSWRLARAMLMHLRGLQELYALAPFAGAWSGERSAMQAMARQLESRFMRSPVTSFRIGESGLIPFSAGARSEATS